MYSAGPQTLILKYFPSFFLSFFLLSPSPSSPASQTSWTRRSRATSCTCNITLSICRIRRFISRNTFHNSKSSWSSFIRCRVAKCYRLNSVLCLCVCVCVCVCLLFFCHYLFVNLFIFAYLFRIYRNVNWTHSLPPQILGIAELVSPATVARAQARASRRQLEPHRNCFEGALSDDFEFERRLGRSQHKGGMENPFYGSNAAVFSARRKGIPNPIDVCVKVISNLPYLA